MVLATAQQALGTKAYPGRGLLVGLTPDEKHLVTGYFIMGRSANSRNRIFAKDGNDLYTQPFDTSLVEDPSLIIYRALTKVDKYLIVTNGDQTDTIAQGLAAGQSWEQSLKTREYEPDAPNYTPRISALVNIENGEYQFSILKKSPLDSATCQRFYYQYQPIPGVGHLLHTYQGENAPLRTYQGEPTPVQIENDLSDFAQYLWQCLNVDNRIALYLRFSKVGTLQYSDCLINKN